MKKTLQFLLIGAFALFAVACSDDEKDEPNSGHDDSYYASQATIGSSSSSFTSTSNGGAINFGSNGGEVIINVSCGTEWTAENSAPELFDAVISTSTLTVSAARNTEESELTGTVTLMTAEERINFATITIVQDAYGFPEISVDVNELNFPAVGDLTAEIVVTCNLDEYEVNIEDSWVVAELTDTGITLTAEENEETEGRETVVELTCSDGLNSASVEITVAQDPKAYLIVDTESIKFKSAGSYSLTYESNFDLSYESSETWMSVEIEGGVITVTVSGNEGDSTREAVLTLTAGEGENVAEVEVAVSQIPDSAAALILKYNITKANTSITLPLEGSTINCTVDWGDGTVETITSSLPYHTFTTTGEHTVSITGTVTWLSSHDIQDNSYIIEIVQWGLTGLVDLEYAFNRAENLKTIATDEFGSFENVTNCTYMFEQDCMADIPVSLFDYATKVENFSYTFYRCTDLTCESPYTVVNGQKVHLYERNESNGFVTPSKTTSCFNGCTKLTDYNDIPSGWK